MHQFAHIIAHYLVPLYPIGKHSHTCTNTYRLIWISLLLLSSAVWRCLSFLFDALYPSFPVFFPNIPIVVSIIQSSIGVEGADEVKRQIIIQDFRLRRDKGGLVSNRCGG